MKISAKCYNDPVLVNTNKPPNTVMYINYSNYYGLKIEVYVWTMMDMVTVEYGIFDRTFHLEMWLF